MSLFLVFRVGFYDSKSFVQRFLGRRKKKPEKNNSSSWPSRRKYDRYRPRYRYDRDRYDEYSEKDEYSSGDYLCYYSRDCRGSTVSCKNSWRESVKCFSLYGCAHKGTDRMKPLQCKNL